MGQKVNPHGLRVGIIKDWDSHWFVDKKDVAANIKEDNEIRCALKKKYYQAAISKIVIEKAATRYGLHARRRASRECRGDGERPVAVRNEARRGKDRTRRHVGPDSHIHRISLRELVFQLGALGAHCARTDTKLVKTPLPASARAIRRTTKGQVDDIFARPGRLVLKSPRPLFTPLLYRVADFPS